MCVSSVSRVIAVAPDDASAIVDDRGVRRRLSLGVLLVGGVEVRAGAWLLSSAGVALRVIGEDEALEHLAGLPASQAADQGNP